MSLTRISSGDMTATIDTAGAQLSSLTWQGREYLWQKDPAYWAKSAPILFPVVGAAGDIPQQSLAGPCQLAKHGFARDMTFLVHEQSANTDCTRFELSATPETLAVYPYHFQLEVSFALDGQTLTQSFCITNTGEYTMPFAIGGHPAFFAPIPDTADACFEDYDLIFSQSWTAQSPKVMAGGLLSYEEAYTVFENADSLALTRDLFEFDTLILSEVPDATVTLRGRRSGHGVRVDFADFDFLGVWSAPDAPFVALEPWSMHAATVGAPERLEEREHIILLEPGACDTRSFSITLM
ncbi:aldose 1-epimerase family protein [Collinsella sp. zg1085]|uniref:aldose 1-epimerase family protein n=1 Tax=Collinsella sp. zg1085 TaxID=2844380 RepID=UPI001C0AA04B|nr:aldose 1-epimerase family protein [Collinsella sp. zg1085]QWT17809.1 aldose 1-epimerase family protein [Collinsella sp. zg1085]